MEIFLRVPSRILAELIIKTGDTVIEEDVSSLINGEWKIQRQTIEMMMDVLLEMSRYNKNDDVDIVYNLYDYILSKQEKEEFLERLLDEREQTQERLKQAEKERLEKFYDDEKE